MARTTRSFTRKEIIDALAALGARLGHSPSRDEFRLHSKIKRRQIERNFRTWNDALSAAGLAVNIARGLRHDELLEDWGRAARRLGKCPQAPDYVMEGKWSLNTFYRRFKTWSGVARAFYAGYEKNPEWQDVIGIIREREARGARPWFISPTYQREAVARKVLGPKCEIVYGEPIDFELLRNAPVNEAGVIFLFGCLARKLGYIVEAIQPTFPDCEAKRKNADGRLRRVRIEFEYESRNFLLHKHDPALCDVIVCWRNNWEGCPIEVVELSKHLAELKAAA
ncbi:MAG: hypothetical protein KF691_13810 [Phycisphaeraceae bacterium]|nr:hypothetical protein [Phycisphaeraceae bacterium]